MKPAPFILSITLFTLMTTLGGCASKPAETTKASEDPLARVNTVARDRSVWQRLLSDHTKIRRTVAHRQEGELGIVEATTESDDPEIAALIIDHAEAMKERMIAGAPVRIWDPVFEELFKRHDKITIELQRTTKGVKIVESSRDPETIALMRSHAMGVSEFIREGPAASGRETPRLPVGAPLPQAERVGSAPTK